MYVHCNVQRDSPSHDDEIIIIGSSYRTYLSLFFFIIVTQHTYTFLFTCTFFTQIVTN